MKMRLAVLFILTLFAASFAHAQEPTQDQKAAPAATLADEKTAAEPATAETPAQDANWRFGLGLGVSVATASSSTDVRRSGTINDSGRINLNWTEALFINARLVKMQPYRWGFIGGVSIESEHRVRDGEAVFNGNTTKVVDSSDNAKIRIQSVFASMAYQWRDWYLPLGFNFSKVDYSPAKGFTGSSDLTSGLGLQFGAGVILGDHSTIEGLIRLIRMDIVDRASNGDKTDYGIGFLGSAVVSVNYLF